VITNGVTSDGADVSVVLPPDNTMVALYLVPEDTDALRVLDPAAPEFLEDGVLVAPIPRVEVAVFGAAADFNREALDSLSEMLQGFQGVGRPLVGTVQAVSVQEAGVLQALGAEIGGDAVPAFLARTRGFLRALGLRFQGSGSLLPLAYRHPLLALGGFPTIPVSALPRFVVFDRLVFQAGGMVRAWKL
jgi:hypothetical protein